MIITMLIMIILVALIGCLLAITLGDCISEKILGGIFGLMMGGVLGVLLGMILGLIIGLFSPKINNVTVKPLVAFSDGQTVSGSFFLGCGSIKGESVYFYYYQRADGGIMQSRESTSKSVIYEEDRTDGVMEIHKKVLPHPWSLWAETPSMTHYKFRVPKGTVVKQFVADLK